MRGVGGAGILPFQQEPVIGLVHLPGRLVFGVRDFLVPPGDQPARLIVAHRHFRRVGSMIRISRMNLNCAVCFETSARVAQFSGDYDRAAKFGVLGIGGKLE